MEEEEEEEIARPVLNLGPCKDRFGAQDGRPEGGLKTPGDKMKILEDRMRSTDGLVDRLRTPSIVVPAGILAGPEKDSQGSQKDSRGPQKDMDIEEEEGMEVDGRSEDEEGER